MKQHYIIEGEYLGSGWRKPYSTVGTSLAVYSYAFFCKKCGRIWASCPIDKPDVEWHVVNMPCPRDTNEAWGGSIFLTYDKEFIEPFTPAVLTREFNWLLSKMENHI